MKKFDYSTKEFVEALSYTTITKNRDWCNVITVEGRKYIKYGVLQAITVVGHVYKDHNENKILVVGISRQHPDDHKCDKKIAYEYATMKALENPDIVFNTVPSRLTKFNFEKMMEWYIDGMDLQYIRTAEEKKMNENFKNVKNAFENFE